MAMSCEMGGLVHRLVADASIDSFQNSKAVQPAADVHFLSFFIRTFR
jgi:hypothetical protein